MKRYLIVLLLSIVSITVFSQKPTVESITKRFRLSWEPFNDFWLNVPDSINERKINQGVNVYGLYTFPMDKKDRLSFFAGTGIGAHNFYHNSLVGLSSSGVTYLYSIPDTVGNISIDHKKSKISITYIDIPFGFQYKLKNNMHFTLGFKVGWKINDHWKYKGDCYESDNEIYDPGIAMKRKYSGLPNIEKFHYGPFFTCSYKWFGVMVNYQVSKLFTEERGPQVNPISVGLTFKPFDSK